MTFVTVGNAIQGFDRLMRAIEEMKEARILKDEIVVQYGHSRVVPRRCAAVDFLPRDDFERHVDGASLVITHGGAGSVGKCLRAGKKPIVVPRSKAFGEIVNDHQVELVRELDAQGRIYAVYDIAGLRDAVGRAIDKGGTQPASSGASAVAALVGSFIDRLSETRGARP